MTIAVDQNEPSVSRVSGRIQESHDGGASWAEMDQAVGKVSSSDFDAAVAALCRTDG
jgi:hypothetical protein